MRVQKRLAGNRRWCCAPVRSCQFPPWKSVSDLWGCVEGPEWDLCILYRQDNSTYRLRRVPKQAVRRYRHGTALCKHSPDVNEAEVGESPRWSPRRWSEVVPPREIERKRTWADIFDECACAWRRPSKCHYRGAVREERLANRKMVNWCALLRWEYLQSNRACTAGRTLVDS